MTELVFVTTNEHKFVEASAIFSEFGFELLQSRDPVIEIQDDNIDDIVDKKAKDAFLRVGRPLFVEHTSLHIDYIGGFPGGLTRLFLSHCGDEKVCELFGLPGRNGAFGQTTIGFCDGRKVHRFVGRMPGRIAAVPKGELSGWDHFGWNRIFVPAGYSQTLSQIGRDAKNRFSMRRQAIEAFVRFLGRGDK